MTHADKFINILNNASSSRAQFFDDFLTAAAASLDRDEQKFHAVVDRRSPADVQSFVKMFGELMMALEDCIGQKVLRDHTLQLTMKIPADDSHKPHYRDVLGEIFSKLQLNDQQGGQVLTPQHTADIMGLTTLTPELVQRDIQRQGFVLIKENCCGSGALILGALNALLDMNINPCEFARVDASDLDERCVLMTFIQLSLYGIRARVSKSDALTSETFGKPLLTPRLKLEAHHD